MQKNNRGFMLIETLLVTITISSILIYLYTQFSNINNSYNKTYKYNVVEDLYAVDDMRLYVSSNYKQAILNQIASSGYSDISACSIDQLSNISFCNLLKENMSIKTIIITNANLSNFAIIVQNSEYSETIKDFTKKVSYKDESGYRIIVEFNDSSIATLLISL